MASIYSVFLIIFSDIYTTISLFSVSPDKVKHELLSDYLKKSKIKFRAIFI
jgi:hypothetical protein